MGPGGGRLRHRHQPAGASGDPHRRHHQRGPQPGTGLGAARPGCRRDRRKGASPPSPRASRPRGRRRTGGRANSSLICSATRTPRRWPVRSWSSAPAGSVFAATLDRSAASPTADRQFPTGSTTRSGRSSVTPTTHGPRRTDDRPAHPHRRCPCAPVGPRPRRLVSVPRSALPPAAAATRRGCTAASMPTPTGRSRPGGTSRSSSTSPPPPASTRSRRPSSSTAMPRRPAARTPSSAVYRRRTPWPRPSSSSTDR